MTGCPIDINYPSIEGAEDPYPQYDWLRAAAPVYNVPGTQDYLITRYADVAAVAKDPVTFSSVGSRTMYNPFSETGDRVETDSLLEADPPDHRVKRDFCSDAFKARRLRAREPMIRDLCHRLIDEFGDRQRVDFVTDFAERLPLLILVEMVGFAESDIEWLDGWARVDNGGLSFLPPAMQEAQRAQAQGATARLTQIIYERAENPGSDELSTMISKQIARDGELNIHYVRDNAVTLLRGGVITTAHLLSTMMLYLLDNPDVMTKARGDRSVLPDVIEEVLRLESPVQWAPRRVTRDTEVAGVPIPAGARVLVMLGAANRDGNQFRAPATFDPHRENLTGQVAFGLGPHFCLGAPLARLESRVAFDVLLDRLADITLVADQHIEHSPSPQFRGVAKLLIDIRKETS